MTFYANRSEELMVMFLALPLSHQCEVGERCRLLDRIDYFGIEKGDALARKIFARAAAKGKLAKLWDETSALHKEWKASEAAR